MQTESSDVSPQPGNDDRPDDGHFAERPWIALQNTYDVEAWIANFDWDLRRSLKHPTPAGAGICFRLAHGGDIFLHTAPDGTVLLDITSDAQWAGPVVAAATGIAFPEGQIWVLPGELLTQLIVGLGSLIAASRPVPDHPPFARRKRRLGY